MKKITAYILSSILVLGSLTGCGTSEDSSLIDNNSATESTEKSTEESTEKILETVRVSEVVHSVFYAPYDVK